MKILITGGAGFIGSHLVDALLDSNEVVVLDNLVNGKLENLKEASLKSGFSFNQGDILDAWDLKSAIQGVDVVYHLACLGVRHSLHSPFENHRVNAEGTLKVLEAAREAKVQQFFYISTSEVYGDVKTFPIKETDAPVPKTVYGASKLAGENYAYAYSQCFGLKTACFRIFNNYGPRAHYEGDAGEIIPRSIVRILYGKQPIIFGDGGITRDFFFVKDTAKVLAFMLNREDIWGKVINIGTGEEITMLYLAETLLRVMKSTTLGIEYLIDRPADVPRLWVDNTLFRKLTGFSALCSFEEGLIETIKYYKNLMKSKDLIDSVEDTNWSRC